MEVHCGFIYQSNALNETAIHLLLSSDQRRQIGRCESTLIQ